MKDTYSIRRIKSVNLISPKQASEYCYEKLKLIVGEDTIRHWTRGLKDRKLKSMKIGGKVFIDSNDLDNWFSLGIMK